MQGPHQPRAAPPNSRARSKVKGSSRYLECLLESSTAHALPLSGAAEALLLRLTEPLSLETAQPGPRPRGARAPCPILTSSPGMEAPMEGPGKSLPGSAGVTDRRHWSPVVGTALG